MARYFRIQPKGLDLAGHYSETSEGEEADGLHVFCHPWELVSPDVAPETYGDEYVVLEASDDWPNEDVEGVCVDPDEARIMARYTRAAFLAAYFPGWDGRDTSTLDDHLVDDWATR